MINGIQKHDYVEISHHTSLWLIDDLKRIVGKGFSEEQIVQIYIAHMNNECYEGAMVPCVPEGVVMDHKEWWDMFSQIGEREMINNGYVRFIKFDIPLNERRMQRLRDFESDVNLAISETFKPEDNIRWIIDNKDEEYGARPMRDWIVTKEKQFRLAYGRIKQNRLRPERKYKKRRKSLVESDF